MGITYRALDTTLHSAVALKVIGGKAADEHSARTRFLREARAAAQLRHTNVASVFHYGEDNGECFYVMELIEGETLEERVQRDGTLSVSQTLEVGCQVARALVAAEVQGVVHRDLKPSNIMLIGGGQEDDGVLIKVIDFGLAKAVAAIEKMDAGFRGTPTYASPEQFSRTEGEHINTRSDIYSLGSTLWFALHGRPPFHGDTLEEIYARQMSGPPPIKPLVAIGVPDRMGELLRSMLAPAQTARPLSARALLEELRRCRDSATTPAPASGSTRRSVWPLVAAGSALALVVVVGALHRATHTKSVPVVADSPACRSIAVLPFKNLSGDPADAFFATGVEDEITADLARVATLKVIGGSSTRDYTNGESDEATIRRQLGVNHLLAGSVQREGEQVRIDVRLVGSSPGHTPSWSRQYVRRLADVFAIQGEITREVAAHLQATLSPAEKVAINRPPTSDLAAYDLYLRALREPRLVNEVAAMRRAMGERIALMQEAIQRDPNFVRAYCELAGMHDFLYRIRDHGPVDDGTVDHRTLSEAALQEARRLQPEAGEVHLAQAQHFLGIGDDKQALIENELARHSLPNNAELEGVDAALAQNYGRWEDAIRAWQQAIVLSPRERTYRFFLAQLYRRLRRYQEFDQSVVDLLAVESEEQAPIHRVLRAMGRLEGWAETAPLRAAWEQALAGPNADYQFGDEDGILLALFERDAAGVKRFVDVSADANFQYDGFIYPKLWFHALAARMEGDFAGARQDLALARAEVEASLNRNPANPKMLSILAMIDAGLGNADRAVEEARRACALLPPANKPLPAYAIVRNHLAVVYAWTDQPDLALAELRALCEQPAGSALPAQLTYGDLCLNPLWDPLRGKSDFQALIEQMAPPRRSGLKPFDPQVR